jgi:molybdopterin molybdotransferase
MLPRGADAVVMVEYTQLVHHGENEKEISVNSVLSAVKGSEIEISRAVADGENVIRVGEDVAQGQLVLPKGTQIRPAEIG